MIWILVCLNLFATDVYIQPEDMSDIEYQTHLSENRGSQSFSYFFENKKHPIIDKIESKLKLAQFEFLEGSLKTSFELFQEIYEMRFLHNWKIKQREIIHYSILRTAQLTKNNDESDLYIKQAILFDSSLTINSDLFPPPMVRKFNLIKSNLKTKVWPLHSSALDFEKLLVNGKETQINSGFIRLKDGKYRFELISNKRMPFTVKTHVSNLANLNATSSLLASEGCISKEAFEILDGSTSEVLNKQCINLNTNLSSDRTLVNKKFDKEKKSKTPQFLKSKWFWIGLSVVATGIAYQALSNSKANNQSVTPQDNNNEPIVITN